MNERLIFTDIDGTLVDKNMRISNADRQAITQQIDQGTRVYVATGRKYAAAKLIAQQLHPAVKVVASNGAVYDADDGSIHQSLFSQEALYRAFAIAQKKNVSLFFFGLSETFYSKDLPVYFKKENQARLMNSGNSDSENQFFRISSLSDLDRAADKIVNGIIISENDAKVLEEIKQEIRSSDALSISSSHTNNIELMPKGISKAAAIKALQAEYAITREDTIAFGDGLNDIEMLKCARYSVAMANAPDSVKAHANYQTLANSESGISYFLKKLESVKHGN
jgi:Cof subfamily protein (haloacid dehalogenase superfamily)